MIFDETYLSERIVEDLEEEMTIFDNRWYEFKDCVVSVTGRVSQNFKWQYSTDHFLLSGFELISRTADFDEILVSNNTGERYLTIEEIYAIERMIDK